MVSTRIVTFLDSLTAALNALGRPDSSWFATPPFLQNGALRFRVSELGVRWRIQGMLQGTGQDGGIVELQPKALSITVKDNAQHAARQLCDRLLLSYTIEHQAHMRHLAAGYTRSLLFNEKGEACGTLEHPGSNTCNLTLRNIDLTIALQVIEQLGIRGSR